MYKQALNLCERDKSKDYCGKIKTLLHYKLAITTQDRDVEDTLQSSVET